MELKLNKIRTDGGTQTREKLDHDVIKAYSDDMLSEIQFPEIIVFYDGKEYWLADGFHRVQASAMAGFSTINADVRQGTQRDAVWYSLGANKDHGLQRTAGDKKRAIETVLMDEEWSRKSLAVLASHVGVTQQYISKIKKQLTTGCELPDRSVVEGKDGRVRNTTNIGRHQQQAADLLVEGLNKKPAIAEVQIEKIIQEGTNESVQQEAPTIQMEEQKRKGQKTDVNVKAVNLAIEIMSFIKKKVAMEDMKTELAVYEQIHVAVGDVIVKIKGNKI